MSPALTLRNVAGFGLALLFACDVLAAVGSVQFVVGDVKVRDAAGKVRAAQKGEAIDEGDAILTGSSGSTQLKMSDGGILAVRPETELKIDTYRFTGKEDGTENALMSLVKGGFRTITGIIGRTNKTNYRVNTGTATIGIRGTDHEPFVILPATAGAPQPPAPPGTYDKVNVGEAFISSPLGTVNVSQNQVGFAAPNLAPTILPVMPEFFRATPPIQASAPATVTAATTSTTEVRDTAVVDTTATVTAPTTTITTTTTTATTTTSPTTTTITQTVSGETSTGTSANLTTQTTTTSTGSSVPVSQFTGTSNPAVDSSNYSHGVFSQKPVTGGAEGTFIQSAQPQSNTKYVLNQNKDLIEIGSTTYARIGSNYFGQSIADANVKFIGGAAKDHYETADGTFYMGRWQGGQIDVTDLATSGAQAPFSDALGLTSAHWAVWLSPANSVLSSALAPINNVQTLLGTNSYTITSATHPSDSSGNVGTLTSASLTANFTRQTVDTSVGLSFSTSDTTNISSRNLTITGSATGSQISQDSFGGVFTTACTGAGCGSNPYAGLFSGAFAASASGGTTTGAVGTGAVLGYRFFPIPSTFATNQPFPDLIDGAVALSTASAPTAGVTPTPVCSTCAFRSSVFYPIDGSPGFTFFASSGVPALGGTSTIPAANYVFDSSGNLVRVLTSSWNAFERATGSQCTVTGGAPCLTSPGPGATVNTMLTMAGGTVGTGGATFSSSTVISSTTATERYSDSTGIRLGRYEGGTVTVQDLETDDRLVTSLTGPSGPRSVLWAVREQPTSIPISGRFDFTPTFATKPTDSFGSTNGTLLNAQLTANFTGMTVQPLVRVSINGQGLSANASGVPIQPGSFLFDVSSASVTSTTFNPSAPVALQVGCSGTNCAPSPAGGGRAYGARIIGGFSGDGTAEGAFFRYTFNTRFDPANPTDVATAASLSRPINDYINGLVAFGKGAQVAPPVPIGHASIGTAYFDMPVGGTLGISDQTHEKFYETSPSSFTITGGNLVSVSADPATNFPVESESISGGTAVSGGVTVTGQASALAATEIVFGRYDAMKSDGSGTLATLAGSENVNDVATSFSRNILGSYHWFKGPEPFPFFISSALTGTATYSLAGYTPPTDQNSLTGSVSTASTDTNLSVDFNKQAVSLNMKVTMPPSTGPIAGSQNRDWLASASNIELSEFNAKFFAFSNTAAGSHQSLTVTLNGSTAFGGIQGGLTGTALNGAGVAYVFGGSDPLNSNSHEHVNGALAFSLSSYNPGATALAPSGSSINLDDVWYRVGLISAGLLPTGTFEPEENHSVRPALVAVQRTALNASGLPVAFDAQWPFVFPSGCTSGCFVSDIPARLSIVPADVATAATALSTTATAASLVDTGFDQGTGIRWGRYAGGKVAVFDRINGAALALIDTTSQSMHILMTAPQTGPVSLPISGTANYVLVGNTNPTDNFGNVGTLGSATFNADFGAQTVSSSVGLTVNSQTWSASVTNAPILRGTFIFAEKLLGGGGTPTPLNVTSSLGTNTAGTLIGGFAGTSGQGAGLAYSLNVNGSAGTTVSGVAAFRRP
ncbi:MAG: FecR domain-containing protein [Betaproteobacteria bacterium]|nr:FecR domain-containing protein [Betaproteobacteria bacterium]